MGFLDNIKDAVQDRLNGGQRNDYYDDQYDDYEDYEDEESFDDSYAEEPTYARRGRSERSYTREDDDAPRGTGLLGNPARPEANSINVYTRSGRRVDENSYEASANSDNYRSDSTFHSDGAYRVADESWRTSAESTPTFEPVSSDTSDSYVPPMTQPGIFGPTGNTPGDAGLTAVPRVSSGKLPAYVLKPTSYDDVQTVVKRVRTNQPVVLSFKNLKIDIAKRILDFSFGLACGIDGSVEELGDRVFVVLPHAIGLTDADKRKLKNEGLLR